MQLLPPALLLPLAATSLLHDFNGFASAAPTKPFCGLTPDTIKNSQPLAGDRFIGAPVLANPLLPKVEFNPKSAAVHADGGNTNTVDYPGPLGRNLNITTLDWQLGQFFWDTKGTMFGVYGGSCGSNASNVITALAVVNPETLAFETEWQAPPKYADTYPNFAYAQLLTDTDQIVVGSLEGQIYVLKKSQKENSSPRIETQRLIDLTSSGVLKGETLLNVGLDADGNVWFTTGALDGVDGAAPTNTTVVGYVEENGKIHSVDIPNQTVGQGIAISNTTIFVNTEPSAKDDHANAVGFLGAFTTGDGDFVTVTWNATYDAGSAQKPGAFARGSGTTPALLGNDFVAITDNADVQINLLIYPQHGTSQNQKPLCKVPLWEPNASWTDNNPMAHFDGKDYGVVVQNMYNENKFNPEHAQNNINGAYNNMSSMSPGISKITVAGDGSECHTQWTNPGRMNTVPLLSTKTGLIYGYEQSKELADKGEYVWYATAMDYESGETVWKARTGAGGTFDNYYRTTFLSPEGTLYQLVQGGVVIIKDGE